MVKDISQMILFNLYSFPYFQITVDYDGSRTIGSLFSSQDTLFLEERSEES